tara:strand:- start:4162 stop:5292 length:1131 start_codon:yes stop_codon:yes gene_type:complete
MKIAFDLVCTNVNSGSLTYLINILQGLKDYVPHKCIVIFLCKNTFNRHKNILIKCKNVEIIKVSNNYSLSYFKIFWIQIILPLNLKKLGIRELFSPLNYSPLINKYLKIKTTLAIHSNLPWVNFKLMPGNYFKKILIKFFMEKAIKNCDTIICASKAAKNEISKIFKITKKVKFIYLNINEEFFKKRNNFYLEKINYQHKYLLTITSCAKYHNILNLLKAFHKLKKENKIKVKYYMVLTILDYKYFKETILFLKKKNLINDVKIILNVDAKYLFNLYKNACAYIFTSYSEVFGYTSLESMQMNCPVAMSNLISAKEINGSAALYFKPNNINQICQKMHLLINNKKIQNELKKKGKQNIKNFLPGSYLNKLKKILVI